MPPLSRAVIFAAMAGLILAACSPARLPVASATLTATPPALTLYRTPTATPTSAAPTPTPSPLPSATPTPVIYAVQKDDDMFGISLRFGVSLPALKTANPKVNPYFLGVGTALVIPVTPGPTGTPAPGRGTLTPEPAQVDAPVCYDVADGGLWCLTLVHNRQAAALESPQVTFHLAGQNPTTDKSQTESTGLDLLLPGAALPVESYFAGPLPAQYGVEARVAMALPQPSGDARYLKLEIKDQKVIIQGLSARLSGTLRLPADSAAPSDVWLLATAFDASGRPVGLRKWESAQPVAPGASLPFTFEVYSLGPAIDKVTLAAEGHVDDAGETSTAKR